MVVSASLSIFYLSFPTLEHKSYDVETEVSNLVLSIKGWGYSFDKYEGKFVILVLFLRN